MREEYVTVETGQAHPRPRRRDGGRKWLRRESNPLLLKELRGRMRGARAFVVLTVYLLLLSCFTSIIYYAYAASSRGPGGGPDKKGSAPSGRLSGSYRKVRRLAPNYCNYPG